jgi:hypothetical protein
LYTCTCNFLVQNRCLQSWCLAFANPELLSWYHKRRSCTEYSVSRIRYNSQGKTVTCVLSFSIIYGNFMQRVHSRHLLRFEIKSGLPIDGNQSKQTVCNLACSQLHSETVNTQYFPWVLGWTIADCLGSLVKNACHVAISMSQIKQLTLLFLTVCTALGNGVVLWVCGEMGLKLLWI